MFIEPSKCCEIVDETKKCYSIISSLRIGGGGGGLGPTVKVVQSFCSMCVLCLYLNYSYISIIKWTINADVNNDMQKNTHSHKKYQYKQFLTDQNWPRDKVTQSKSKTQ